MQSLDSSSWLGLQEKNPNYYETCNKLMQVGNNALLSIGKKEQIPSYSFLALFGTAGATQVKSSKTLLFVIRISIYNSEDPKTDSIG